MNYCTTRNTTGPASKATSVVQGITDFGQDLAGEIVYAEVPRIGRDVKLGEPFMSMESGKWVGRIKAVVSARSQQ